MKKLQNNFTTPEQSKRLLEVGVPADSADMLWDGCVYPTDGWEFDDFPTYSDKPFSYYQSLYRQEDVAHILPCWSVGRLLEIMALCYKFDFPNNGSVQVYVTDIKKGITVDVLISDIERFINKIDFSKLEE